MAEQLTFGQYATGIPVQDFPQEGVFELDPELLAERKRLFEESAKTSLRQAYLAWQQDKKTRGWGELRPVDLPEDYDDFADQAYEEQQEHVHGSDLKFKGKRVFLRGSESILGEALLDNIARQRGWKNRQIGKGYYNAWADFKKFWSERNKERVETLNPVFLQSEFEQGGVDLDYYDPKSIGTVNPNAEVFFRSMLQKATIDVIDTDSDIYKGAFKQYYNKAHMAGSLVGEIMSLMSLTYAAQGLGVTTKLASALKKSNTAARFMRLTGHLPASLRRSKGIVNGLHGLGEFLATPARARFGFRTFGAAARSGSTVIGRRAFTQGVSQLTSGLIFSFADTTRSMAKQFIREDKLDKSAWEKLNAANPIRSSLFGFLKGYGINVINAPTSWGVRFVADGAWSTAQQGANVIAGGKWNTEQFIYDWIISHAIGERFQVLNSVARALTPTHPLSRIMTKMRKVSPDFRSLSDDKQLEVAIWAQGAVTRLNQPLTTELAKGVTREAFGARRSAAAQESLLIDAAKIFTAKHKEMAPIIDRAKHENYLNMDVLEGRTEGELNAQRRQMAVEIAKIMKLSPEQAEELIRRDATLSPERLFQAFKDLNLQKETAPELIEKFTNVKRDQLIKKLSQLEAALEAAPEGDQKRAARLSYLNAKEELAGLSESPRSTIKGISENVFVDRIYRAMVDHTKGISKKPEVAAYRQILSKPANEILEFILPNRQRLYRGQKVAAPPFRPTPLQQETINRVRGQFGDDIFIRKELQAVTKFLQSKLPAQQFGPTARDMTQNIFLRLLSPESYSNKRLNADIDRWKGTHPDFDFNNIAHLKELASNIIKNNAFNSLRDRRALKGEFAYLKREGPADFRVDQQTAQEYEEGVWIDRNTGEMTSRPDQITPLDEAYFQRSKQIEKFRGRSQSTKRRKQQAGKDAKNTGGIDLSSVNNKDFAVLAEIARRDPANVVNSLIRFWDDAMGLKHDEIREHLSNYGISRTPKNIEQTYGKMLPSGHSWKAALIRLDEPLRTTVRTTRRVSYSLKDAQVLHRQAREMVGDVNPRTGIKTSLESPAVRAYAGKHGVMVVGIKDYVESIGKIYTPANIERLKMAVGEFIQREVAKYNKSYAGQKGNPQIILRHPVDNNSTDFIITGYNLDPTDFKGVAVDIYNRLTARYPKTADNVAKAFAVKLMGNPITKIPGATLSYTKDLSEIKGISDKHLIFNRMLRRVSPAQFKRTEDILLDMSDPTVRAQVNALAGAGDVTYAEGLIPKIMDKTKIPREDIQRVIDNTPVLSQKKPAIRLAEDETEVNDIMGEKNREQAITKNRIKSRDSQLDPDKELRNTRSYEDDDTGILRFMDAGDQYIMEKAKAVAEDTARLEASAGLFEGVADRLKEKIRSITRPIDDIIKGKFTIFEDILKIEPTAREILGTIGIKETIAKDVVRGIEDQVYGEFYKKYGIPFFKGIRIKNPLIVNRLELFNKIEQRVADTGELVALSEGGDYRIGNWAKGDAKNKSAKEIATKEPISNENKVEGLIQKVINDPSEFNDGWVANVRSLTKDNYFYTKFAVQKLGIDFEDFYNTVTKSQTDIWDFGGKIAKEFDLPPGAYRDNAAIVSVNKEGFKIFANFFQRYGELAGIPKEQRMPNYFEDLFLANEPLQAAKKVAQMGNITRDAYEDAGLVNEEFSRHFNEIVVTTKSVLENDPINFTYRHHAVLADSNNNKFYGSRLNKMAREGRMDVGQGALNPSLYDIKNRKHRTLDDLSSMGMTTDHDSRGLGRGFLTYVLTRQKSYELGRGWKEGFMTHTERVLGDLKAKESLYDRAKENAQNYDTATQIKNLQKILKEIDSLKNDTIAAWGEHSGVVYVDNTKDISFWKTRQEMIRELITEDLTPEAKEKLELELTQLQRFIDTSQDIHDFTTGAIFNKKKRDFLNTFKGKIEGLDAATVRSLEESLDNQERADRGLINDSLFDAGLKEIYMPIDAKTHNKDKHSEKFSGGRDYIYTKPLRHDPNKITVPGNMPGFEGLYIHRALHKGLKQFIFRYDYENTVGSSAAVEKTKEIFDSLNRTMKTLSFWKPTIVASNDLAQSLLAIGLSPSYVFDLVRSIRAFRARNMVGTSEYKKMYQAYRERNLFHHSLGFNGLISDAMRDYSRMVGDGLAGTIARSLFNGDVKRSKIKVRTILGKMMKSWHQYNNITWSIDEVMRMAVAENFRRRFYPVQLAYARRRRVQNPEATALDEALWLATERTNMFLADYSRVPDYMRRSLNRFIFVPTFKIAQMRMYKNMLKEFGQGIEVLFKGIPEGQRAQVSEKRLEQAMFMMGPAIRKVIYSTAIKGIAYGLLGYNFEDKLDMIKGYRLRKVVGEEDPMSSMIRFLSLSTPMFEMEKFFGRLGTGLNIRYNMAALPGLMVSIATNKDRITGQRIWDRDDDVRTRTAKFGLHILRSFFPIGADISNLPSDDLGAMARVLNLSGLGYFYQTDSPNKLLELFYDSINRSNTVGDRRKALREFNRGIQRVNRMLLDERFRSFYDELNAFRESRLEDEF